MATRSLDKIIHVSGLSWKTGSNELKKFFGKYGAVFKAYVQFDPETGLSKRIGYVRFQHSETVDKVLKELLPDLDGRTPTVVRGRRHQKQDDFYES